MNCNFIRTSPDDVTCTRCGHVSKWKHDVSRIQRAHCGVPEAERDALLTVTEDVPPAALVRNRQAVQQMPMRHRSPVSLEALPCVHRGESTRMVECPTCSGNVKLKVYSCKEHEECTIGKKLPDSDVACCKTCPDRKEREHTAPKIRSRPIRVGFLSPALCVGGIEQWMASMCRHLPPSVVVSGVAIMDGAPSHEVMCREISRYCPVSGSCVLEKTGHNSFRYIDRFQTGLEAVGDLAERSDVLITWGARNFIPDYFKGPVISVSHGDCAWTKNALMDSIPATSHFVAVSNKAKLSFHESVRDKVTVIYNGVEFDRLLPTRPPAEMRAKLNIAQDATVVGFIGRLTEDKNPLAACRAVGAMKDDAILVFVGTHWKSHQFEEMAKKASKGRCILVPPVRHVGDYLAMFDCLTVPSPSEGFGLVIVEGWAAGCPVVCDKVGIVPEMEQLHGQLTTYCPYNAEPEAMAASFYSAACLKDSPRVEKAKQVAVGFNAAANAHRWAEYLETLVER